MYMHPQAVIIDGTDSEDVFFLKSMRSQSADMKATLIELPENAAMDISWFTKLDSSALAGMACPCYVLSRMLIRCSLEQGQY